MLKFNALSGFVFAKDNNGNTFAFIEYVQGFGFYPNINEEIFPNAGNAPEYMQGGYWKSADECKSFLSALFTKYCAN